MIVSDSDVLKWWLVW